MEWTETSTSTLQQIQSLVRRQEELGDLGLQLLGLREHRDLKVNKELRESRGRRATWDLLVLKGLKVIKGYRVHKASRVKWGHKERRDLRVFKVHRARKERKAIKGFKESKVSKVYRERLVQPGQMDWMERQC